MLLHSKDDPLTEWYCGEDEPNTTKEGKKYEAIVITPDKLLG